MVDYASWLASRSAPLLELQFVNILLDTFASAGYGCLEQGSLKYWYKRNKVDILVSKSAVWDEDVVSGSLDYAEYWVQDLPLVKSLFDYWKFFRPHCQSRAKLHRKRTRKVTTDQGVVAEWFGWMSRNGLITTWDRFVESVKNHFGPSKYEDPQGALSKLLQLGTVEDYQREFEKLMNMVTGIPESLLISYYISGLKLHLQRELLVSKHTTLGDMFSLAQIIEARFDDQAAPVAGTSAGLEANKVVNDGDDLESSGPVTPTNNSSKVKVLNWVQQSIDVESTYDNDARDQVSELEMKVLVDDKQDEAKVVKVVVVAVEQNINELDVEGNGVIGVGVNENKKGVQYSVSTLHVLILLLERLNDQYIRIKPRAELQASLGQLQGRPGGNDDQGSLLSRSMRLDVPKFTGEDPEKWFVESVKNHFGPSKYEDPQGALSKLLQLGTVEDYQREFEKLMNMVTGIPESLLISYYISGLKLHLQRELLVSKHTTLGDVFSLAQIIEARFDDQAAPVAGPVTPTNNSSKVKVLNWVQQSIDVESTYDNDARDQVSELEMKVLVDDKQDEAKVVKVVVVAVEQNINEPDMEGNGVIGVGVNENKKGVQYSVSTLHVLILLLKRLNDQYIKKKKMEAAIQRRIWDPGIKIIFF
ncbi:retrotransposon-related protein [Tanacetum coccineum]